MAAGGFLKQIKLLQPGTYQCFAIREQVDLTLYRVGQCIGIALIDMDVLSQWREG